MKNNLNDSKIFTWLKNNWKSILKVIIILVCFYGISFACKKLQPYILNTFNSTGSKILLWFCTVLLSGIIPGPFMPLVIFCNSTNLLPGDTIQSIFSWNCMSGILLIWSAVVVGKILSYILGNKLGKRCTKWILSSEEKYEEWSEKLNKPKGLTIYCVTVALPLFPDFLLAYVAGSLKINFKVYLAVNAICKFIDIIVVLMLLRAGLIN